VTVERARYPRLPFFYFALAHVSLGAAFAALAFSPVHFVGFFYHPRMVAVVHLVTLGWISASILGALYMVGPIALRAPLPAGRWDAAAFAGFAIGTLGMVGHFWIDEPRGMAWAAGTAYLGLLTVAGRTVAALRRAPLSRAAKLPFDLAFLNLAGAGGLGLLLGLNKTTPFLPGSPLARISAHAHLAALGWAAMMVVGAGFRLLPMLLPAAMPGGRPVVATTLLLEAGVLGLAAGLWAQSGAVPLFSILAAAGLLSFLAQVAWMRRHPRPAPRELRRPDWGVRHVAQALVCLLAAAVLGLGLAVHPAGPLNLRAVPLYGALGLIGFLARMVVGVNERLFPLYVWMRSYGGRVHASPPPSPHALSSRPLQATAFWLWTAGLPLLLVGLALERPAFLQAGAAALLAGVATGALAQAAILWRTGR
jgi:hypothetical protein